MKQFNKRRAVLLCQDFKAATHHEHGHQEQTPSLVIWKNTRDFHCFGCHWRGNLDEDWVGLRTPKSKLMKLLRAWLIPQPTSSDPIQLVLEF